jgi:hypothetical protein
MKTLMRYSIVPALFVGAALALQAQDTAAQRTTGKVLLLKNGNVIEGDIAKVGVQWCVRRGASEVWLAEDKATRLCADWDDAYAFAQTLIKGDSPGERVKLARWCHLHGQNDYALAQAKIALELQPNHADARQIVTILERAAKEPAAKPAAPTPAAPPRVEPAPTVDVSAETLIAFSNRVQPILMNKCASCHAMGFGGKFCLERVADNGIKASTQRNLAAVLNFFDLDRPAISPLLVKAITAHGDAPAPPIRDRSAKPFQSIQEWLDLTIRRNPQLRDYHAAKKPPVPKSQQEQKGFGSERSAADPKTGGAIPSALPRTELAEAKTAPVSATPKAAPAAIQAPTPAPTPPAQATAAAAPLDPYSPEWFNRTYHPQVSQQQAAGNGQQ